MKNTVSLAIGFAIVVAATVQADEKKADDGFVPLFNGKDLTGWVNVNCHPKTFFVKEGMLITTGKPTGFLRTAKQYENFICEFEWMHMNKTAVGNSGFFVWGDPLPGVGSPFTRGIEVQVLVNLEYKDKKSGAITASSHGDVFSIQGATCKPDRPHPTGGLRCIPSEFRAKGGGEWNHYKIIANNGVIKLHVNGKEVSGVSECKPRKGYLAFESEGAECRFKNVKIKELPSTNPKPEEIGEVDKGFTNLYTGLDLDNWLMEFGHEGHWKPQDSVLHYDGMSDADVKSLYVAKEYEDYELIVDWKFPPKKDVKSRPCGLLLRETDDYLLTLTTRTDGKLVLMESVDTKSTFLADKEGIDVKPTGWNRTIITMKGGKLSATLNSKAILENVALDKKSPKKGEVALMHEGVEIDFANVFIRELK